VPSISHEQALAWMNINLALLATDQQAVRRIRGLVAAYPSAPADFEPDVRLLGAEMDRLLGQLQEWEELVHQLQGGAPGGASPTPAIPDRRVPEPVGG
jgi:hypothetical protein